MELINICDLVRNHQVGNKYLRYDFFVKLLAIENYYERNDFGIILYNRVQPLTMGKTFQHGDENFENMIKSFEENGFIYDEENFIVLNKHKRLTAGAHRLACCMYFGIAEIPCLIDLETKKDSDRSADWFRVREKIFGQVAVNEVMNRKREFLYGCV